ncbi:hypothetical protein MMC28_008295, partial [Mycoblastus sanguinarius]|nr:hypothetical protein [Mycoblastus sanguinarius]
MDPSFQHRTRGNARSKRYEQWTEEEEEKEEKAVALYKESKPQKEISDQIIPLITLLSIPSSGTWVFVFLGKAETNTLTGRWDSPGSQHFLSASKTSKIQKQHPKNRQKQNSGNSSRYMRRKCHGKPSDIKYQMPGQNTTLLFSGTSNY